MKNRLRGYTAVEILSAMTLFAIGAAGVIGMQKVSINGSADARRFDIGSNIANEWLYRLQRDAAFWTLPNNDDRTHQNIDQTRYLAPVFTGSPAACTGTGWCTPPWPATSNDAPAFDVLGHDRPAGAGDHFYCVQYRLNWIANPWSTPKCNAQNSNLEPCVTGLVRAEVRVYWARLERGPINDCGSAPGNNPDATPTNYHFIYAATTVRQNSNFPDSGL